MRKIKKLWDNNRVLFVLISIILICFIIIGIVGIKLFVGINNNEYGNRLEGMKEYSLKEEDRLKIIDKLKEEDTVSDVSVHTQGKIIYIKIYFHDVSLERAKEIAVTSLEVMNEDYLKKYDIHYTISEEKSEDNDGFILMGAKNINRSSVIWGLNRAFSEDNGEEIE